MQDGRVGGRGGRWHSGGGGSCKGPVRKVCSGVIIWGVGQSLIPTQFKHLVEGGKSDIRDVVEGGHFGV